MSTDSGSGGGTGGGGGAMDFFERPRGFFPKGEEVVQHHCVKMRCDETMNDLPAPLSSGQRPPS